MADKWIQKIKMKKGALTAMARRSGKSLSTYCEGKSLSPIAKKRCALRKTLLSFKKS